MAISLRQLIAHVQMIAFKWCKTNVALLKWFCATLFQCGHLLFTWKTHCSLKFHFGENKDSENKIKKIKILKNQQKYFCRFFQKSKTDWVRKVDRGQQPRGNGISFMTYIISCTNCFESSNYKHRVYCTILLRPSANHPSQKSPFQGQHKSVLINQFAPPIFCLWFAFTGINFRGMLYLVCDVPYDENMWGPIRSRKCRSTNRWTICNASPQSWYILTLYT